MLEDLPETGAWMKVQVGQVFPQAVFMETTRLEHALALMGRVQFDLALIDLGLPDGSGIDAIAALRATQPNAKSVVITIHDDAEHLFPALQAGAFGYLLKDRSSAVVVDRLRRMSLGEPPLSPAIARRLINHFAAIPSRPGAFDMPHVSLSTRETDVLLRVAKGFTLPEIAVQLTLSRHTVSDYVKQIYRKLNVSSRAEAALEAQRLGLFTQPSRFDAGTG